MALNVFVLQREAMNITKILKKISQNITKISRSIEIIEYITVCNYEG